MNATRVNVRLNVLHPVKLAISVNASSEVNLVSVRVSNPVIFAMDAVATTIWTELKK